MKPTALGLLSLFLLLPACPEEAPPQGRPPFPSGRGVLPANASALDHLSFLGALDQVLALPRTARSHARPLPRSLDTLPLLQDFKAEEVLLLGPGLVLCDPTQSPETRQQLERAGLSLLLLGPVVDRRSLMGNLERLGSRLGIQDRVRELGSEIDRRISALEERRRGKRRPRVLPFSSFNTGIWTAGRGTGEDFLLRLAGARNQASERGLSGHREVSSEWILADPPDWFLVSTDLPAGALRGHPYLSRIEVVRRGRILALPAWLRSTSSPFLLEAAEKLAVLLEAGEGR